MRSPLSIVAALALLTLVPPNARASEQLDRYLRQIYDSKELQTKTFGPARWIEGGAAYTTLEPSATVKTAKEVIRYETAWGKRSVLVSAESLTPSTGGVLQ